MYRLLYLPSYLGFTLLFLVLLVSLSGYISVTPSVLRPKQTTKLCHEHHVYVIKHVIECVDKFLVA